VRHQQVWLWGEKVKKSKTYMESRSISKEREGENLCKPPKFRKKRQGGGKGRKSTSSKRGIQQNLRKLHRMWGGGFVLKV